MRLAIDIGGTFTDVVLQRESGAVETLKVFTTSDDITRGIMDGVARAGVVGAELESFIHGTTVALNALLEGKTPPVGLITTAGFRDVLEIMRTNRPAMYDLQQDKPEPLVPRELRREISARIAADANVLVPVDDAEVRAIAAAFAAAGVASVAVCLLNAYVDGAHEREVADLLRHALPDVTVSISSDLTRQWREFERTSTTVCNAATKPIVAGYLASLEDALRAEGYLGELLIMQSNGGVMTARRARERPVATLMSGPIGGVSGALEIARAAGTDRDRIITLDIGGTSADVAIIDRGEPVTRAVGRAGGWPIMVPMVDIEAIGAGGGSLARVDEFGGLSVGPQSAGAMPGPACYRRGGVHATVTDANVVLGRINAEYFLAGDLVLDVEAAREAIERDVARHYGMTVETAAEGIVAVVNANMTRLLGEAMMGRGYDPRTFMLLAYGGAGPLHACDLARALGIGAVAIPVEPGTFSALGILHADIRYDHDEMLVGSAGRTDAGVAHVLRRLRRIVEREVDATGLATDSVELVQAVDVRYAGQDHTLAVRVDEADLESGLVDGIGDRFHTRHEQLYGFRREDREPEIISARVSAIAALRRPRDREESLDDAFDTSRTRPVFADGMWHDAGIYDRSRLPRSTTLIGPIIVEERGSTTYVPAGCRLEVADGGLLHIAVPIARERVLDAV